MHVEFEFSDNEMEVAMKQHVLQFIDKTQRDVFRDATCMFDAVRDHEGEVVSGRFVVRLVSTEGGANGQVPA